MVLLITALVDDQLAYAEVAPQLGKQEALRDAPLADNTATDSLDDEKKGAAVDDTLTKDLTEDGIFDPDAHLPTQEELRTLRRLPAPVPWRAFGVGACELGERFSYYGVSNAWQNFIQQPRPPYQYGGRTGANRSANGVTGALGKGQQAATGIVCPFPPSCRFLGLPRKALN